MKRFLSIFLTVAMLITLLSTFAVTNVAAATVISNASPAITATAGTAVNLSGYSVVFDGDSTATSGVTWKNSSGTVITSITPSAGVTKLTAVSGSKTKTIYVVAKTAAQTEYVLYEASMSSFGSVAALRSAGWTLPSADSMYSFSNGNLKMIATGAYNGSLAFLPAWLADFGNYNISVEARVDSCYNNDTSRWLSVMYRSTDPSDTPTYYHYCIRDAASSNGVEFTERIAGDAYWNVVAKSSARATTLQGAFHTFGVEAFDSNVKYTLDGRQCHYMLADTYNSKVQVKNTKGYIGLQTKGLSMSVKSVKVTVQETTPSLDSAFDLINIDHDKTTLVDSYANIQTVAGSSYSTVLGASDAPGIALMNVSEISDVAAVIKACISSKTIPTFYITSNAEADKVVAAVNATTCEDVTVISNSASVLGYIRGKYNLIRTGLKVNLTKGTLTSKEAHAIRVSVRSAPASFCVVESTYATKQVVAELQELAVAVWVNISSTPGTAAYDLEAVKAITSGANGFISKDSDALTEVINKHFIDGTMVRTPIVVGHRGNPSHAAENSMESFEWAYKNGADIFELDCYVTSDNRIVIFHDWSLTSTAGLTTAPSTLTTGLNNMTLAQIQQYTYSTGEKIPTLDDVLYRFQNEDIRIYVEFKGGNQANCVKLTSDLIKAYGMEDRVDVICSATGFLTETYKSTNMYGMSTGYLCYPEPANVTDMTTALQSLYNGLVMAQPVNSSLNQLCNRTNGGYFGQAATDRGVTVWPWGYGLSAINTAFFTGCDGITVDHAEWFTDLAKDVIAKDFTLAKGQASAGGILTVNTYGRYSHNAETENLVYSVISGDEYVKVQDGKLIGVAEGSAKVVVGYKTTTTDGTPYVIYAQPVTVTVDSSKEALAPLMEVAKNITVFDYTKKDLASIRALYAQAEQLTASANPSEAEISAVAVELATLLNNVCYTSIISNGVSYTTTANTRNDVYADDGKKLTDGQKAAPDGGTAKTSGWNETGKVDVTLDFKKSVLSNEFNAYIVGGTWGIPVPASNNLKMTVSYSADGSAFTEISATTEATCLSGTGLFDDSWSSFVMNIVTDTAINARYIKFSFDYTGNHLWIDEVEAVYTSGIPAASEVVYIDAFNSKILAGNSHIFTPDYGTLTLDSANHVWTQNLRAKWDANKNAYVVTEVFHGQGADNTPNITLASGEIFIAAHQWEDEGVEDPVAGSRQNTINLASAKVGDIIELHGIDVASKSLGIAPSVSFKAFECSHNYVGVVTKPDCENGGYTTYTCSICGDSYIADKTSSTGHDYDSVVTAPDCENGGYTTHTCSHCGDSYTDNEVPKNGHTEGQWVTLEDGSQELRCTVCGELLDTKAAPEYAVGDVNADGSVDMFDYLVIKNIYFDNYTPDAGERERADLTDDGSIDMFDYLALKSLIFSNN